MAKAIYVKPYVQRVKNWKIRNMVMLYLEAREQFRSIRSVSVRRSARRSFDTMREICDMLYEIKEDHHLLYRRLVDLKKKKFEKTYKFMPDTVDLDFMNNIGLLFHKVMVARELQYVLEHYVEESETFQRTKESLDNQLALIASLFDDGIRILKELIRRNNDNMLLLTLLLENSEMVKRHFGAGADAFIREFVTDRGLDEVYFSVGRFYFECGRRDNAARMLKAALKQNSKHEPARGLLAELKAA